MSPSLRRLALAGLAAAVVPLAGCGSSNGINDATQAGSTETTAPDSYFAAVDTGSDPTTPAADPATAADIGAEAYVLTLAQKGITAPNAQLLNVGHRVCDALDAGNNVVAVGTIIAESGFTYEQAGTIVGAAIEAFCPAHSDQIPG